jgi:hypothetical protein
MPPFALNTAGSRLCMRFPRHNKVGPSIFQMRVSKSRRLLSDDWRWKHRFLSASALAGGVYVARRHATSGLRPLPPPQGEVFSQNSHASTWRHFFENWCMNRLWMRSCTYYMHVANLKCQKPAVNFGEERLSSLCTSVMIAAPASCQLDQLHLFRSLPLFTILVVPRLPIYLRDLSIHMRKVRNCSLHNRAGRWT